MQLDPSVQFSIFGKRCLCYSGRIRTALFQGTLHKRELLVSILGNHRRKLHVAIEVTLCEGGMLTMGTDQLSVTDVSFPSWSCV